MNETVLVVSLLVNCVAIVSVLVYHFALKNYKEEFINYRLYHQKVIILYMEAARRNRELIKQNNKYKHAVIDSLLQYYDFDKADKWYKTYDIKHGFGKEEESESKEVEYQVSTNKDVTKNYNSTLG